MAANDTQTEDKPGTEEMTEDVETQQAETAAEADDDKDKDAKPAEKTPAELQAEAERLRKQLKETNRKALADRKRLEDIDREKQEREDSKLSETARLKKQIETEREARREAEAETAKLKKSVFDNRMDREIERVAKAYFADPELAPKLVDRDSIEYDEETGKFSRVQQAVERVIKDHPKLANAQRGGGSPAAMKTRQPGGGSGSGDVNAPRNLREEFLGMGNYEMM